MRQFPPRRIVCLTEETVETLYLLGEQDRIVGVSGYAVRPPQVRREKPRVSAFISADIPKILALEPDLVLAFSDLQADIVADLVRAGVAIHVFNQRDVAGILAMIRTLGALVGAAERADQLAIGLEQRLAEIARRPALAKTKSLFRGMGRSADQRHRLGVRADRDRRRRRRAAEAAVSAGRQGPDHFARCRARPPRPT
jgi:iron complex transport system substrate-binding protein